MNITIAAATKFEIHESLLRSTTHNIQFCYTGVGILASAVSLTQQVLQHKPDLIIQAGIAGCFNATIPLGNVVAVEKEYVGDIGVWEHGEWKDVFDMNFVKANEEPFISKSLVNEEMDKFNVLRLPKVTGVTINEITTNAQTSHMLTTKYGAEVESMEGASLHYVCSMFSVPFIQIRGISNYVGERDKSKWKIKEAIENVNEVVWKIIMML
jgi:futalosine hydrolase